MNILFWERERGVIPSVTLSTACSITSINHHFLICKLHLQINKSMQTTWCNTMNVVVVVGSSNWRLRHAQKNDISRGGGGGERREGVECEGWRWGEEGKAVSTAEDIWYCWC